MKYLLFRFDDIHPYMDKNSLEKIVLLSNICANSILLCVIPDNKDEKLKKQSKPINNFWEVLSDLEKKGITIGLHGLHHKLYDSNKSILNYSKKSEFTGYKYDHQKRMINKGLSFLRAKGLNPRFFAAPAHGFDLNTLKVLKDINFRCISDGFFAEACIRDGLTWIPLKTWDPSSEFLGRFNTVCIHLNISNFKDISYGIKRRVLNKENTSFDFILNNVRNYNFFDFIVENLYKLVIKFIFIKKFFKNIFK